MEQVFNPGSAHALDLGQIIERNAERIAHKDSEAALVSGADKPLGFDFGEMLTRAATQFAAPQAEAQSVIGQFSRGEDGELHQSMMAMGKSDINFKFMMTAKNRCIEAYKEIMRMS